MAAAEGPAGWGVGRRLPRISEPSANIIAQRRGRVPNNTQHSVPFNVCCNIYPLNHYKHIKTVSIISSINTVAATVFTEDIIETVLMLLLLLLILGRASKRQILSSLTRGKTHSGPL